MEDASRILTDQDYAEAARDLGVEEARIRAVCAVESAGNGFLKDGRVKILFEGHIFWKELERVGLDPETLSREPSVRDILYPSWTRQFYKGGAAEYERLERAARIDRHAALRSASWGGFQILGSNCKACGFDAVEPFVEAQSTAAGQLKAFCGFIRSNRKLHAALSAPEPDWESFARWYNGPGYKKNLYDARLAQEYEKAGKKA